MLQELQRYFKDPSLLQHADVAELEKLATQFPYASLIQIFLAKKYHLENHPKKTQQLSKAALTVNDRSRLFSFLQKEFLTGEEKQMDVSAGNIFEMRSEQVGGHSSDDELHDILKSIHENKQALLQAGSSLQS